MYAAAFSLWQSTRRIPARSISMIPGLMMAGIQKMVGHAVTMQHLGDKSLAPGHDGHRRLSVLAGIQSGVNLPQSRVQPPHPTGAVRVARLTDFPGRSCYGGVEDAADREESVNSRRATAPAAGSLRFDR